MAATNPLYGKCLELRDKVDKFLAEDHDSKILKDVQAQLRLSMAVVEDALARYSYGHISS